jgi:hypothetical protein
MFTPNIIPVLPEAKAEKRSKRLTKAEAKAQLVAEVAAHLALVRGYNVSVDTTKGLTDRPVMPPVRAQLRAANENDEGRKISYNSSRAMQYGHRFDAQKQKDAALICMDELVVRHIINGFDPAYDLITDSPEIAQRVALGFRRTMTLRWPGPQNKTGRAGEDEADPVGTFYIAPRFVPGTEIPHKTRRNLAIYCEGAVVHVEPRYFSARTCRKRGIRRSTDLIDRDFVAIIDIDFRFSAIHWKKLYKLIEEAARAYVQFVTADDPDSPVTVAAAEGAGQIIEMLRRRG